MSEKLLTNKRVCPLCEAMCGITLNQTPKGIVVRGDENDPISQGYICPKGTALYDLHHSDQHLKTPMIKENGQFRAANWDEALDLAANLIHQNISENGLDSLGIYAGNPSVHSHHTLLGLVAMRAALPTRRQFSATSVDQLPLMLANYQLFGNSALFPLPDIDRTDYFLCLGANPLVSNGSLMSFPNAAHRLKNLVQRGGKMIVIDPRLTETAELATQHLFIKPASDAYFLAAIIHEIFLKKLMNIQNIQNIIKNNFEIKNLEKLFEKFTPEIASAHCGIAAETIREIAHDFAHAKRAVAYGRMGTSTQIHGGLASYLIVLLNMLTGRLDQVGGSLFAQPAIDLVTLSHLMGMGGSFGQYHSVEKKLPEFGGELPVAEMAGEIASKQMSALITICGNPVLSTPAGNRLEGLLPNLRAHISIDTKINATNQYADVILPPSGALNRSQYDMGLHLVNLENYARFSPIAIAPAPNTKNDGDILFGLASRVLLKNKNLKQKILGKTLGLVWEKFGDEKILELLIALGPYGQIQNAVKILDNFSTQFVIPKKIWQPYLAKFSAQNQNGALTLQKIKDSNQQLIQLGKLAPQLPARLCTQDKKINLLPDLYVQALQNLASNLNINSIKNNHNIQIIGRRLLQNNNSWMHHIRQLNKGKTRCIAHLHPETAANLGLKNGSMARLTGSAGSGMVTIQTTKTLMPNVVSLPHGYGLRRETDDPNDISYNDIVGVEADLVSGVAAFNGAWGTLMAA